MQNTTCVIFVVDSNDVDRLGTRDDDDSACDEIHKTARSDELRKVPFLIYANKQDLPHAVKPKDIAERLELNKLKDRDWHVQGTSSITGQGIFEGMEWVHQQMNK